VKWLSILVFSILLVGCGSNKQIPQTAIVCKYPKFIYVDKGDPKDINISVWKETGGTTSYISMTEDSFSRLVEQHQRLKSNYNDIRKTSVEFNLMVDNLNKEGNLEQK
jgi:hypothetical protein